MIGFPWLSEDSGADWDYGHISKWSRLLSSCRDAFSGDVEKLMDKFNPCSGSVCRANMVALADEKLMDKFHPELAKWLFMQWCRRRRGVGRPCPSLTAKFDCLLAPHVEF